MTKIARILVWRYGAERALLITLGLDPKTNADLARWRELGRR